jgi:hypothetical protein
MGELSQRLESLTPEKRALLREALRKRAGAASDGIPRRREAGPAQLSFSQQRMWFLDQWEPGAPAHNGARALRIVGAGLDVDALRQALTAIVERHESLRTVYVVESREPRQVALEEWSLVLPVVDLQGLAPDERELELARLLREESRRPFDLRADLMLRPKLFRLGPNEHVLLLAAHHIAFDAASDRVLNRELAELYDAYGMGRPHQLPDLPIQYADFAVWQRERLQGNLLDDLVAYWRAQLEDAPTRLRLPTDRARPPVQRHRGSHHYLSFDGELGRAIADLSRREGVTVFMALLAVFDTLLYRFTGQDDILVGAPIANRNHVELEGLIGFFTNTLVLRSRVGGNPSFRELLQRVRETALGAYAHQDLPFEKLVETLRVPRDPSFNPVFQVNFRGHAAQPELLQLPGLTTTSIAVDLGFSRFDLALELQIDAAAVSGYFEYDEDLFDLATIEALAHDLERLLHRIVLDPDLPILTLASGGGRSAAAYPKSTRIPRSTR